MKLPTCAAPLALLLLVSSARGEEAPAPAPWPDGPRVGILLGAATRDFDGRDPRAQAYTVRVDGDFPAVRLGRNTFSLVVSPSYSLVRVGRPEGDGWLDELRLMAAFRWSIALEPALRIYLDGGAGPFWSDHTPPAPGGPDRWSRAQLGVVGRVGAGLAWDTTSRSRWILELNVQAHVNADRGAMLLPAIGYAYRFR